MAYNAYLSESMALLLVADYVVFASWLILIYLFYGSLLFYHIGDRLLYCIP